eukprot:scaffold15885_cov127-Isochrysis_galbana.AAC.2
MLERAERLRSEMDGRRETRKEGVCSIVMACRAINSGAEASAALWAVDSRRSAESVMAASPSLPAVPLLRVRRSAAGISATADPRLDDEQVG